MLFCVFRKNLLPKTSRGLFINCPSLLGESENRCPYNIVLIIKKCTSCYSFSEVLRGRQSEGCRYELLLFFCSKAHWWKAHTRGAHPPGNHFSGFFTRGFGFLDTRIGYLWTQIRNKRRKAHICTPQFGAPFRTSDWHPCSYEFAPREFGLNSGWPIAPGATT